MSFDIAIARTLGSTRIDIAFAVEDGLTVLFGPSGVGKTSVLNMIAGLLRPDRGHIRVGGTTLFDAAARIDVPPERRRIGYVFQDGRLFPHRRVRANLLYGHHSAARDANMPAFDDVVAFLGIAHLLDRWPRALSGGEIQRVAIGRALLSGARTLLMDEPLSSLDRARREEVMTVILRLRDELNMPVLYVTHDPAEADRLATRRILLHPG